MASAFEQFKAALQPPVEEDEEVRQALERKDLSWVAAFRFVGRYLWRHPWLLVVSLLLGVAMAAAEVLSLALIFPFIESLSGGGESLAGQSKLAFMVPYFEGFDTVQKIQLIALSLVVIQLFKAVLGYVSGRVTSYQRILLDRDLRADIFDQIVDLELSYINRDKVANLYTILHAYASDTASMASELLKGIRRSSKFVGYLAALLLLSWQLTLVALVLAAVTTRTINFLIKLIRRISKKINVLRVRLKHVSLEALNGLKVVHLFGREDHAKEKFRGELVNYQDNKYKRSLMNAAVGPIYSTMMTVMFAGILVAGTLILDTTAATWVAILTMFLVVMSRLMSPTAKYAKTKAKLSKKLPAIDEIKRFLDRSDKPYLEEGEVTFQGIEQGIRMEDLWFRYDEDGPDVLKGINVEIPQGSTVALVGRSGAGKSTLVDLIARLQDPTQGRILVDGRDLRELVIQSWRHRIAVVSQETFLFNVSAMENIRYGRLDASDEEVLEAAKQANAHAFLADLPEGYETPMGERGVRLSGGQAQRIAIARAILADPDLLILDEATSALDTQTEREVQQAIDRVSQDRTVIAIAHRLSTVKNADQIIVLEEGEVAERGTHEELLQEQGRYWDYVQMQDLSGETEGPDPGSAEDEPPRLVVELGRPMAEVRVNGHSLGEVPVLMGDPVDPDCPHARVLRGDDHARLRLNGHVHERVPIYLSEPSGNGDPPEERQVRVFDVIEGRAQVGG